MGFSREVHKMYDIHMHIIPGVDDGSWNLEMSKAMIDIAYRQGIRKIIATSHSSAFDMYHTLVKEEFEKLKEETEQRLPDMKLYLGNEIYCRRGNMENILNQLNSGIYPSMNGTKYVLVEFASGVQLNEVFFCIDTLLVNGWIPIIAHVERYRNLFIDEDAIKALKEKGVMLQINIFSVYEEYDEKIKRNALRLIERRLVDFLGSDAHRTNHRPPSVEYGLSYLYANFDSDYVEKIAFRNAEDLLLK